MSKIIINADDFGVNSLVNEEIERMIDEKAISSTSIMANGKALAEAISYARVHPEASFGVHLCLSEFNSLTESQILEQYGITDNEGVFIKKAIFHIKSFDGELRQAIKAELRAQIRLLKSFDIPLSHCDSHHHVHTIWGLQEVIAEVLKEEGFDKMRIAWHESTYNKLRHPIRSLRRELIINYYKNKFATTDEFYSYSGYIHTARRPNNGIVELMCHPGHPDYVEENKMVQNKVALIGNSKELITYNDL